MEYAKKNSIPETDIGYGTPSNTERPVISNYFRKHPSAVSEKLINISETLPYGTTIASIMEKSELCASEFAECVFLLDTMPDSPAQWVTATAEMICQARRLVASGKGSATVEEVLNAVFSTRPEHTGSFSKDALTAYNKLYFSLPDAGNSTPALFNVFSSVSLALTELLDANLPRGQVKIKELCAGTRWQTRWKASSTLLTNGRTVEAVISDFKEPSIPQNFPVAPNFSIAGETFDLREPVQRLAEADKVNAVLCCYGFDSVVLPGDFFISRLVGTQWFELMHRIGVPDWHPKRQAMLQAFRGGEIGGLTVHDFKSVILERIAQPICIRESSLLQVLEKRFGASGNVQAAVPLGMVRFIDEMFQKQIRSDGIMVIGDAGVADPTIMEVHDVVNTGVAAKFKGIDFLLASDLLAQRGFKTDVFSISDLLQRFPCDAPNLDAQKILLSHAPHTHLMTVQKI